MNIYLHVEVSLRELDSKLLLGVIAASRGHHVLISDISEIERGLRRGILIQEYFILSQLLLANTRLIFIKN